MADNVQRDSLINDILRKAKNRDIPVKTISRKKLDEISERGSHQGVIAEALPFEYVNGSAIIEAAAASAAKHDGRALVVVLDHLTDAGNLGAIARSAESVGAAGIVIPNKRAARVTAATYKSSAGAISHIPVAQVANEGEGVSRLVLEHCDFGVKLPQVGDISSLNVAQASTACMYEWLRQNRTAAEGLRG